MNNLNTTSEQLQSNILYLFKEKVRIQHSSIILMEAKGNYTLIHLKNEKKLLIAKTLKSLEENLNNNQFYRIHRTFLINRTHLMSYNSSLGEVLLTDNHIVNTSRRKKGIFERQLSKII